MNQENFSRVAVIARADADMDILDEAIGSVRIGPAQARRVER